ncbi:P22 phage major capsid protein family protein [Streptomyces sp. NPDC050095]|uniref:P22 phage major capsid protein family protein n=1 Tax=unclassified Streptomyces TaxID=2593676 RepID=UPI003434E3FF
MANKITLDEIAPLALPLLEAETVLGSIVYRDADPHFKGGNGETISVRIPHVIEATESTGTDADIKDINETAVPIKLSATPRNLVKLTAREMTLEVRNFRDQVLVPSMAGTARFIEKNIAATLNKVTTDLSEDDAKKWAMDKKAPLKAVAKAAAEFTRREVESNGRYLVIGPDMEEAFLNLPGLQEADKAGDANALRNGTLGRLMGFTVVVSPYVDHAVALTRHAAALAVRAPISMDTRTARTETHNGYAQMITLAHDVVRGADFMASTSFCGSTVVDPRRMIAFKLSEGTRSVQPQAAPTTHPAPKFSEKLVKQVEDAKAAEAK